MAQPNGLDGDVEKGVDDYTLDEIVEIGGLSDDEFARQYDPEPRPEPPKRLPPDLDELYDHVSNVAIGRRFAERRGRSPDTVPCHEFDRFEAVGGKIGGMGLILEARDPVFGRKVAIKLWKQSGPKAQQALLNEAKTLGQLSHRNVVTVFETGVWGERVFFVMEWIDGVDGHEWLKTPRSWQQVREVFIDAGEGLAAAHAAGIQHRDFKPDNILIGHDGRTVVIDFGVADSLRSVENTDPRWGTPAGTPEYMAPERLRGEPGDARSDLSSFCVAMWLGLYGVRPFAGRDPEALLQAIELGEPRMPADRDVPRWLTEVLRKGLAWDPADRYQSMPEMIAALRYDPSVRAPATARERWLIGATSLLASGMLVMGYAMWASSPEPPPVAVEAVDVSPYQAILGLVAKDEFSRVERLLLEHEAELTDAQLLAIGEACLQRSKELEHRDRAKADEAARVTHDIAEVLRQFGRRPSTRDAGDRLRSGAKAQMKNGRPASAD